MTWSPGSPLISALSYKNIVGIKKTSLRFFRTYIPMEMPAIGSKFAASCTRIILGLCWQALHLVWFCTLVSTKALNFSSLERKCQKQNGKSLKCLLKHERGKELHLDLEMYFSLLGWKYHKIKFLLLATDS